MPLQSYNVPSSAIEVEEILKGSQFITRVQNVSTSKDAKAFIKALKTSFPEASHHCWAYIVGNPNSTTLIGCSDDGEPSGTAGKPMLHVLKHAMIGDIVIVITRYFGGTKLGTGGLARAYGGGVKRALEKLTTEEKIHYTKLAFYLDYSQQKDFEHLLETYQSDNLVVNYSSKLEVSIELANSETAEFKQALINLCKGDVEWIKKINNIN
ncbi:MAG: YigZ family protein [Gammaproteobacteria bacterium]|nr:MAG: YigZ family protein [Gammaproteobacteria bacterium]